jgi:high-affinity iron transporter
VLDPSTWYAALLAGMFNVTPAPTVLETIAWVAYAVPVLVLFLRPGRRTAAPAAPATTPTTPTTEAEAEPASSPQRA